MNKLWSCLCKIGTKKTDFYQENIVFDFVSHIGHKRYASNKTLHSIIHTKSSIENSAVYTYIHTEHESAQVCLRLHYVQIKYSINTNRIVKHKYCSLWVEWEFLYREKVQSMNLFVCFFFCLPLFWFICWVFIFFPFFYVQFLFSLLM